MFHYCICVTLIVTFLGPLIWPLMGSFPGLLAAHEDPLKYPYVAMHRLFLRHGEVMSVGLGPDVWVVLVS